MCGSYIRVKSVSPLSPRFSYVPCGWCEDCRRSMQMQWAYRLTAELTALAAKGWHVGFITLTYSDEHLPILPSALFDEGKYEPTPCFAKKDIQDFIRVFRERLRKKYGFAKDTAIRYFLAAESGFRTYRPHYHALFCWSKCIRNGRDVANSKAIHSMICDLWRGSHGHVFPRYYNGGKDAHGYAHEPFELQKSAITHAVLYCSKYACKDIQQHKIFGSLSLRCSKRDLRPYSSFHLQSRSLGLESIKGLSDAQKLDLLKYGRSFGYSSKMLKLPLYLRNKLLFDNVYYYVHHQSVDDYYKKDGVVHPLNPLCSVDDVTINGSKVIRRLCRRSFSSFFYRHASAIAEHRVSYYQKIISNVQSMDYWIKQGVDYEQSNYLAGYFANHPTRSSVDDLTLARYYVGYFGVRAQSCYNVGFVRQYLSRFQPFWMDNPLDGAPLLDPQFRRVCNDFWHDVFYYLSSVVHVKSQYQTGLEKVREFFKGDVAYASL